MENLRRRGDAGSEQEKGGQSGPLDTVAGTPEYSVSAINLSGLKFKIV